jgi:hypothetical protein
LLNLLETKEPNDEEIHNFEKKVFPKNIPLSLIVFVEIGLDLEVDDKSIFSSETFLNICKYLRTPRVLKNIYFDEKMNEFQFITNLLNSQSSEWENLTFEIIQEHRFFFKIN